MMEHIDEGILQALLDGELNDTDGGGFLSHLKWCATCQAEYEGLQRASAAVSGAFGLLDDTRPVSVVSSRPPSMVGNRRRRYAAALPRAAMLLFGFAAVGSASLPGSPVRAWIEARLEAPAVAAPEASISAASEPAPALAERGIGTSPHDGRLRVVVTGASEGLPVRIRFTPDLFGGAFSIGDTETTRFRSAGGLIEVFDAVGDELRVEIPASAVEATVEVNGRTVLLKEGDRLQLIGDTADVPAGDEILYRVGG